MKVPDHPMITRTISYREEPDEKAGPSGEEVDTRKTPDPVLVN